MTEDKNNFLAIVNQMIGTMKIEPSKINYMGANAPKGTQVDTFNEMMDAAIAKAHQVMEEANKYGHDGSIERSMRLKVLQKCMQEEHLAMMAADKEDTFDYHKRAFDFFKKELDSLL